MKSMPISETPTDSRAGDVLLLPIAGLAFWTLAYQVVLVLRWPAKTITLCFLAIAIPSLFLLRGLWKKTNTTPGKYYRFHFSHILLVILGIVYATTVLFVRRPNQDDVVYFHRALTQLLDLNQPIYLRQTSVDMDAAAFSPVHLSTSYEMLMAFLGHYLRIDPLYFYQVVGHAFAAFSLPFVFYWCARIFGLNRWLAAVGALLGIGFLLLADKSSFGALLGAVKSLQSADPAGWVGFSTLSGYMWQGKPIVLILFLPMGLALSYRFLSQGKSSDLAWLTLLGVAGVGLSNPSLYLLPAIIGCSWIAFITLELFEHRSRESLWRLIRLGLLLTIPLAYPVAILALLKMDIIPKPVDIHMLGQRYMPWGEAVDYAVGGRAEYLRDVVLMIAVPLLIVRGRSGFFLFFYLCAVWLFCLNPLLARMWMANILAPTYFRLVYLLQLPLLCTLIAGAGSQLAQKGRVMNARAQTVLALSAIVVAFVGSYHGLSVLPRYARQGIGWKSPRESQLLPANLDFAKAAGPYIAHAKLLAPNWTASCELPLLFPEMKVVAPRLVAHYFANAGNPDEGILRRQAQAFIEENPPENARRLQLLEPKFRHVIETDRANAVAVPESESQRVLATLKSINPGWHRVLEAGGLVLMLPGNTEPRG
ncbi:MAG: hypothetical protein AUI05_02300 [Verrucomicrobia bacterium 13_2_20CM_2_54_15_9cls]|nr:MAG: hypothetical protein AUI05_02300 [Verrucomicrobia bacterium 13_2_20CM_2_54_15_9cls]